MKTNKIWKHVFLTVFSLVPLLYLFMVWNTIPAIVPVHYNASWEPDAFKPKSFLWFISSLITSISIGCYFLLQFINRIDPKRASNTPADVFDKIAVGILLFLTVINQITLMASAGHPEIMKHALLPLIGLLFAFLGNFMHNVKPNYFVGLRLPWALNDDENWRRTHHLAGKLWFFGGLLMCISSFFITGNMEPIFVLSIVIILVLVPTVYSFLLFRKSQQA